MLRLRLRLRLTMSAWRSLRIILLCSESRVEPSDIDKWTKHKTKDVSLSTLNFWPVTLAFVILIHKALDYASSLLIVDAVQFWCWLQMGHATQNKKKGKKRNAKPQWLTVWTLRRVAVAIYAGTKKLGRATHATLWSAVRFALLACPCFEHVFLYGLACPWYKKVKIIEYTSKLGNK